MELFYSPSACSLSPHIVLRESGLDFTLVRASMSTKKTRDGRDLRDYNPLGYVPTLVLADGTVLTEGPAIVQYVADQVPDKKLAPENGTLDRARCQSWLNFISTELHQAFSPIFKRFEEDTVRRAKEKLNERFTYVDEHLAKQPYLLGDFSVADAYLFTVANWSRYAKIDMSGFTHIEAFMTRMKERPAVHEALSEEGLL